MRCTQQPLPLPFSYDYFPFLPPLVCPAPAAFVVAVCELESLGVIAMRACKSEPQNKV